MHFLKSSLVLLIVLLASGSSFAQKLSETVNCQDFKNGSFLLEDASINYKAQIVRSDTLQMEYDIIKNKNSLYAVNWLDDCNYTLNIIRTDFDYPKEFMEATLNVQIYLTRGDTVFYRTKLAGFDRVSSHYMIKTED